MTDTDMYYKGIQPNVSTAPNYSSTEYDLINHQQNAYRSLPAFNLISPSSIPSPSVSAKQSIYRPEGLYHPYASYLRYPYGSIPGYSAFHPFQYAPVPTYNPIMNTNVNIGCNSSANYPIISSMQNVSTSEVQALLGDKLTTPSEVVDIDVVDNLKENVPVTSENVSNLMETDFEEQFLTEIVPQTKPAEPAVLPEIHNKKNVQFLPQSIPPEDNSMQTEDTVCHPVNNDRFSLKTSIPISKIDMRSITSHVDTVFTPSFVRSLVTPKTFNTVNETLEPMSTDEAPLKEREKETSEKVVPEFECPVIHETAPKQQVFLHSSSPEMITGKAKIVIDNDSKLIANVIPTVSQYNSDKHIKENDLLSLGFEGKTMTETNNTFNINANIDDVLNSNVSIESNVPAEIPTPSAVIRTSAVGKPVIENFAIDGLKSNVKISEPEPKKKYMFVQAKNVNKPRLMLAISQKPSNPNSIMVMKSKVQEERLLSRAPTTFKKPKDNLLLTEAVPERNSKVVALKRLHQDNGDENDFENLITENQIYGNKILIKEKTATCIVPEKSTPIKKVKISEGNAEPDTQSGNYMMQPNILYVSNLQLQPTSSNFVVLGNKPVYSQISNDEQTFVMKPDGSDVNAVNQIMTTSTSDINQQSDLQNKVSVGQTFRAVNPMTHTVSYVKTNNTIEPTKQNNVLQNLLNKPNLKTAEGQVHQKIFGQRVVGQLVNNQIVYKVPVIIDKESAVNLGVNVTKPAYVNSELAMLLSKQPNHQTDEFRNNTTRLIQAIDRKEADKPKSVNQNDTTQSHIKTYVVNMRPDSPVEEEVSSLDLAEKRMRLKRKKKLLQQGLKGHSKNSIPKPVDGRKNNNKLVYNRCSGFHDLEYCDENETESEEEENFSKENLFITNGPTLPLDSSGEKINFMSIFELTTKVGKNEKELEKLERSLKQDSVSQARLSVIDSSPISPDPPVTDDHEKIPSTATFPVLHDEASAVDSQMDNSRKTSFFGGLNLFPVSNDYKIDHEYLWKKFSIGKRKYDEATAKNVFFEKSSCSQKDDSFLSVIVIDHTIDLHGQLERMTEIKKSVTENNNLIKKKLDNTYCVSGKEDSEEVEIPLLAELNFCEINKLSNMANSSLNMIGIHPTDGKRKHRRRRNRRTIKHEACIDRRLKIYKERQASNICIPSVPKIISLKSMQLSSSVDISPATSMDEPRNSAAGSKASEISGPDSEYRQSSEATLQIPEFSTSCIQKVDASCQVSRWAGVTAVLESYQRHTEEYKNEKELLLIENKRLRKELTDRNQKEAVPLNNEWRNALSEQKLCEEQYRSVQKSLDLLKNCIRQITTL